MSTTRALYFSTVSVGFAIFLAGSLAGIGAGQTTSQSVPIDNDDLGGLVTSTKGPEAGVWVIAETNDLPTKFVKIVVTDELGRYVLPDLPKASYSVWVRGYGLVDSPKVQSAPGKTLNLTAVVAPNELAAAQYYPAGYWFSLLRVPDKSEFSGTRAQGNDIPPNMKSQAEWLRPLKSGNCWACHQMGNKATREIPAGLGHFNTSVAAWDRRIQSGQAGGQMSNSLNQLGRQRTLAMFADWTDRIAAGEVPPAPPRPQGAERNIVITQWDWADPKAYLHDSVSTDRRNPRLNANGLIYGALELSADYLPVLDPVRHATSQVKLTVRDPLTPPSAGPMMPQPSPYWGNEAIWTSKNNVHNPMLDGKGRVWITSAVRPPANPDFCKEGSSHPSAKLFPISSASRHLAVYDPKTRKLTHISTCFGTHHLMFAEVFEPPWNNPKAPVQGFSPRGMDIDRNGVVWAALASGHLASFDRRKCKGPLNGPAATGQHCPEGWTLYPEPLPQLKGLTDSGSAEASYYTWVDWFDTSGFGRNVPINTGNGSEGLLVLKDGKWVVLRVPYPMGFYTKWLDGRIDDPNAGWKGKGLWSTVSTRAPFHMEGGKGTTSKVVKFQFRLHPLAR